MQNTSLKLKRNYYHHFLVGFFVFMVSFLVGAVAASSLAPVSDSSAESKTTSNDKTGFYVTVTNSDDVNLSVDGTPVGQMASAKDTINVKTNAPLGYKLLISASSTDMYSSSDTDKTGNHFSTVTGTLDNPTVLGQNTWGFSLNEVSIPIPDTSSTWVGLTTTGTQIASKNIPTDDIGDNINIYYGINANTTMPTGTYTTTVTYTAFAEGTEDIPLMQDFTLSECANMDMDTTTTLMDKRNGKSYTIVKARDGNCWMADNLKYQNVPSSNWDTNDYSQELLHIATNSGYEGEHYYNYTSAINVCPTGWKLPVNGGTTIDKSYAKLINAYGVTTSTQLMDSSNDAYILGFHKYYGMWSWDSVSERYQGSDGFFWSSTAYSDTHAYYFLYDSTTINPQYSTSKGRGYSVRCVMDNPVTIQNVTYMQDVTATICANTPTDATWRLLDKRGYGNGGNDKTTTYGVIKARDGNCWMTDNLAIYNQTISSADSDLPSGTIITLPASTTWSGDNNYSAMLIHIADGTGQYADKTGEYYGEVYYNWCASLGKTSCAETSGTINQSICPKGWRLPINGAATQDKSWAKLLDAYSISTGADLVGATSSQAAYSLGIAKYYGDWIRHTSSGSEAHQGEVGIFWSSTAYSGTSAYNFWYNSTAILPQYTNGKGYGYSIRCVLR